VAIGCVLEVAVASTVDTSADVVVLGIKYARNTAVGVEVVEVAVTNTPAIGTDLMEA
jgi:metal-sulfur cluster biosynthetic enzyme